MRAAVLAIALLAACGPTAPEVIVQISRSATAPTLDTLSRLTLIVHGCDNDPPIFGGDLTLTPNGMGQRPEFSLNAQIPPNTPFYVWLEGWATCTGPCMPETATHGDSCTCFSGGGEELMSTDGCSDWLLVKPSSSTNINVRLGPHMPTGLCPPKNADCPKPG